MWVPATCSDFFHIRLTGGSYPSKMVSIPNQLVFRAFRQNLVKCGGFLSCKHKLVVFGKFEMQSDDFMLLTQIYAINSASAACL
jgi:hypothetical protein